MSTTDDSIFDIHDSSQDDFFDGSSSDGDDYAEQELGSPLVKRKRTSVDDKRNRYRERNRVHARNTRERKKLQLDLLYRRMQDLVQEKKKLQNTLYESSVATILMSIAGIDVAAVPLDPFVEGIVLGADAEFDMKAETFNIDLLKGDVGADCLNVEDRELEQQLLVKDRSQCSRPELQRIRREKNRMHARKARFRKKKILEEMLSIINKLEGDISKLGVFTSLNLPVTIAGSSNNFDLDSI